MNKKLSLEIYTDGGSSPGRGAGGWAVIILYPDEIVRLKGYDTNTTNNQMELTAAIKGLESLENASTAILRSDSEYLIKSMNEWMQGYKDRNWRKVKNVDLMQRLDQLNQQHEVTWEWVEGHAGDERNKEADRMVKKQIQLAKKALEGTQ